MADNTAMINATNGVPRNSSAGRIASIPGIYVESVLHKIKTSGTRIIHSTSHLAFAMKNLNLIIDAPIILSGYLAPYFTEEDIDYLTERLHRAAPFMLDKAQILVGTNGQYTPAIGAALHYVEEFVQSI